MACVVGGIVTPVAVPPYNFAELVAILVNRFIVCHIPITGAVV
jgi:hypothetical protein